MEKHTFNWKKLLALGIIGWAAINLVSYFKMSKINKLRLLYHTHIIKKEKKVSYDGKEFKGDSILVGYGALELDLRKAVVTKPEVKIELYAGYSGVKIIIPETWKLVAVGKSVMGGFSDMTKKQEKQPAVTLKLEYEIEYAGVEVLN